MVVAATMVTMTVQVCVGMYWPLMWTMKAKVLPLIAAALRLRLAHVDADVVGYSRGRARHRAQPVQVKHRQLRRNHLQPSCSLRTLSSSLSAQSAPQSLRRHHHVAQVYLQILFISCLSQPPPPPPPEAHTSTKPTSSALRVQLWHSRPFCRFAAQLWPVLLMLNML